MGSIRVPPVVVLLVLGAVGIVLAIFVSPGGRQMLNLRAVKSYTSSNQAVFDTTFPGLRWGGYTGLGGSLGITGEVTPACDRTELRARLRTFLTGHPPPVTELMVTVSSGGRPLGIGRLTWDETRGDFAAVSSQ